MDRAFGVGPKGTRRVTAVILLAGLAVMVWALASPDRRRERAVGKLALSADTAQVIAAMGRPGATCPTGSLDHLRERFPTGTPPATVDQAMARMQKETAERWIYPLKTKAGQKVGCTPGTGATEVGLDRNRRVLWYVPNLGRRPVVAPDRILPAGGSGAS